MEKKIKFSQDDAFPKWLLEQWKNSAPMSNVELLNILELKIQTKKRVNSKN